MKDILYLLLIIIITFGCKDQESLTAYNQTDFYKLKEEYPESKITIIDTNCINQEKQAKIDIANGKLYYIYYEPWFEQKEMNELLSKYNIECKYETPSCIEPPKGFEKNCYAELMSSEINSKISRNTIDSLWKVAERNFVIKYPDSVYIKDGMDIRKKYLSQ